MADNATTVVRWSWLDPDTGDDGDDTGDDGIITEGDASIDLELADEFDIVGYCEAARRLIKAHITPGDMNVRASITTGTITGGQQKTDDYSETITFRKSDSYTLRRNLSEITFGWEGQVIGMSGEAITPPSVSYSGGVITLSVKVAYGNLKVIGRETYKEYIVVIDEDAVAVFAFDGGVADITVPMPDMECKTEIDPDDDDEKCYIRDVLLDPCTKDVESDQVNQSSCS